MVDKNDLTQYIVNCDVVIEPDDHEGLTDDLPDIVALSFFSGAMGLDIGMKQGGISALFACEFEKYCRMTIAENDPEIALIGDINKYTTDEMLRYAKISEGRQIDVIFGGRSSGTKNVVRAKRL